MRLVYLDHHATTPVDADVLEAMLPWFSLQFGNASSRSHAWGTAARQAVERARSELAGLIGATPRELVFTSGATEANNLAILGLARASMGRRHLVTVATEHAAVLDPMRHLEANEGFSITVVGVDREGRVDLAALADAVRDDTLLVSCMLVNNEVGTLQPLDRVCQIAHARGALVHTDAAQALCFLPLDLRSLPVDLLSLSGHKMYGPKGVGALFVRASRPRVTLQPLQFGGGHESGLRSGTLPVPLIVGLGAAAARCGAMRAAGESQRLGALRDRLVAGLCALPGVASNGPRDGRAPHNAHLSFAGADIVALQLALRDIALSSGSACASENPAPSHVLLAMAVPAEVAHTSLRFGLGWGTSDDDITYVVCRFVEALPLARLDVDHQ